MLSRGHVLSPFRLVGVLQATPCPPLHGPVKALTRLFPQIHDCHFNVFFLSVSVTRRKKLFFFLWLSSFGFPPRRFKASPFPVLPKFLFHYCFPSLRSPNQVFVLTAYCFRAPENVGRRSLRLFPQLFGSPDSLASFSRPSLLLPGFSQFFLFPFLFPEDGVMPSGTPFAEFFSLFFCDAGSCTFGEPPSRKRLSFPRCHPLTLLFCFSYFFCLIGVPKTVSFPFFPRHVLSKPSSERRL